MYVYPFFDFLKVVAADVRSPLPANLNEVIYKGVCGAFFDLKMSQIQKI